MTEENATETAEVEQAEPETDKAQTEPNPETDWKAEARKWEQRAKENRAEADSLRSGVAATEQLTADLAASHTELDALKLQLLRHQVAGRHGITDTDDIDLFLTGGDEATLTKQAERLASRATFDGPRTPAPDPNQRRQVSAPASTGEMFADALKTALNH